MRTENLIFLPPRIKVFAILILVTAIIFSGAVVGYYVFLVDAEHTFVLAALSVFQITTTGAAIALVLFYSRRALGRDALMNETTNWLIKDLRESLELIELPFEPDVRKWTTVQKAAGLSRAKLTIDHQKGANAAHYLVSAFGIDLFMRVTLNSHRFIILYYVPSRSDDSIQRVKEATEIVLSGARLAGFDTRIAANPSTWDPSVSFVEVYCIKEVRRGFLMDSSERLYWSQDIATMTRSLIIQLKRHGLVDQQSGLRGACR